MWRDLQRGSGARYSLGYRDIVAAFVEIIAEVNYRDGLVLPPVRDDTVPAHLMAADPSLWGRTRI